MTQDKTTFAVVTKDHMGALRSTIFVSRQSLVANVEPMLDDAERTGSKVTINPLQPGDFVVRSVRNGRRRKFEVLAGAVPVALVAQLPEFADLDENRFIVPASAVSEEGVVATAGLAVRQQFDDVVVLTDGAEVVEMPGATRVN